MKPTKRKHREKARERSDRFWREIMGKTSRFLKEAKAALKSVNKREESINVISITRNR